MIEKKILLACSSSRPPECYNKLLLSRDGEDEGGQGEEASAKRLDNLKD